MLTSVYLWWVGASAVVFQYWWPTELPSCFWVPSYFCCVRYSHDSFLLRRSHHWLRFRWLECRSFTCWKCTCCYFSLEPCCDEQGLWPRFVRAHPLYLLDFNCRFVGFVVAMRFIAKCAVHATRSTFCASATLLGLPTLKNKRLRWPNLSRLPTALTTLVRCSYAPANSRTNFPSLILMPKRLGLRTVVPSPLICLWLSRYFFSLSQSSQHDDLLDARWGWRWSDRRPELHFFSPNRLFYAPSRHVYDGTLAWLPEMWLILLFTDWPALQRLLRRW